MFITCTRYVKKTFLLQKAKRNQRCINTRWSHCKNKTLIGSPLRKIERSEETEDTVITRTCPPHPSHETDRIPQRRPRRNYCRHMSQTNTTRTQTVQSKRKLTPKWYVSLKDHSRETTPRLNRRSRRWRATRKRETTRPCRRSSCGLSYKTSCSDWTPYQTSRQRSEICVLQEHFRHEELVRVGFEDIQRRQAHNIFENIRENHRESHIVHDKSFDDISCHSSTPIRRPRSPLDTASQNWSHITKLAFRHRWTTHTSSRWYHDARFLYPFEKSICRFWRILEVDWFPISRSDSFEMMDRWRMIRICESHEKFKSNQYTTSKVIIRMFLMQISLLSMSSVVDEEELTSATDSWLKK